MLQSSHPVSRCAPSPSVELVPRHHELELLVDLVVLGLRLGRQRGPVPAPSSAPAAVPLAVAPVRAARSAALVLLLVQGLERK